MSDESQSERIWKYAMQTEDVALDLPSKSTDTAADTKKDDNSNVSADFSNSFRPTVPIFQLHGLAESQSQTLDALDVSEVLSERGPGDQEQIGPVSVISYHSNRSERHATPPRRTMESTALAPEQPPSENQGPARLPALENGHVTGASPPRGGSPTVGRVTDVETKAVPIGDQERRKEGGHNQRLLQRNKASSFHVRPQEPSLLPPLKRINTMPPRLNRYAPRDIEPSSQDSFAGSPPRQDLNAFIRNSRVFNNIVIRPGLAGQPSEVFELPLTESSEMAPPPQNRKATTTAAASISKTKEKNPEEHKDEETPSQLIQAALEHGLIQRSPSPASASLSIVLAKDTQSDHHQSEDDGSESKFASGDDIEVQSDVQSESQTVDHSPAPSSSSFILPKVPAMNDDGSPQPTQVISQDISSDMIIISQHGIVLGSVVEESGASSIPVPEYRKLEFLQHYRNRSEIVPATPISTVPASGAGIPMAQHSTAKNDNVRAGHRQPTKGKGKERAEDVDMVPIQQDRSKLITKPEVAPPSASTKPGQSSKTAKLPETILPTAEIVPDSQEGSNSSTSQESAAKSQPAKASTGEVVPDSQEEEQRLQLHRAQIPPSSPSIPLAQQYAAKSTPSSSSSVPLIQMTNRMEPSGFPTPTPAAVKSPLRKGLLPGGVTHTRGRGRPSTKGKEPAKAEPNKDAEVDDDENQSSDGENNVMEVDEEKAFEIQTARQEPSTSKRTRRPTSKAKVRAQEKRITRQRQRRKSPVRKVASRKRKSEPKLEQQPGELPPLKRHRSSVTTPGPLLGATELTKRVLARRQDDDGYFHSGTVHLEFTFADPLPTSFVVEFDDGFEEPIDLVDIRSFQLEPEDLIEVTKSRKNDRQYCRATVLDTDHWQDDEIAQVHDVEGGPDGDDYDVNGQEIRVSEEQIRLQWNERCINLRTLCKDKEFDLPRRNKHLTGYAFIVTLPDLPKCKRSLQRVIELSGGVICEWHSIVSLSGTSEVDGNRVVGKSADVRLLKNKTKIKNLFCIADEPRTTPKFLIALALGVPCLSVDWVLMKVTDSSVKFDWQAYILPAGTNPVTRLAASQNFERMWWHDTQNYIKLVSEPPVLKPFAGKSFLCIGPSFILKSKEFGTYPKVLLAMGASTVQVVTDLKYLNTKGQVDFDYTVVDDDAELVSYNGSLSVNILWIKKCLITGIEGPVPWPE